ncbi:MAG: GNAT family N-acetyltransferase [Ignavibacteriaceae bacterium]
MKIKGSLKRKQLYFGGCFIYKYFFRYMLFMIIVDSEITLMDLEMSSSDALYRLIDTNRAYLDKWLSWVEGTRSVMDTINYIFAMSEHDMYSSRYVMEIWHNNLLAGLIDVHNGDRLNKKAEMGYWLGEKFQGKGVMTRSCRAIINYAFYDAGLNRITVKCAEGNEKSQAIPKRLNFTFEGIEKEGQFLYDKYVNLLVFSTLKKDWSK